MKKTIRKQHSIMNERKCGICKQVGDACDCVITFVSGPELKAQRRVLKAADLLVRRWDSKVATSDLNEGENLYESVRALRKIQ
jgi:hypothetical protein